MASLDQFLSQLEMRASDKAFEYVEKFGQFFVNLLHDTPDDVRHELLTAIQSAATDGLNVIRRLDAHQGDREEGSEDVEEDSDQNDNNDLDSEPGHSQSGPASSVCLRPRSQATAESAPAVEELQDVLHGQVSFDPAAELKTVVAFDSFDCNAGYTKILVRNAYRRLVGARVMVNTRNKIEEKVVTHAETMKFVQTFFDRMLGGVVSRLQDIAENVHKYNGTHRAHAMSQDKRAPQLIRQFYDAALHLHRNEELSIINYLQHNIALVRLMKHWDKIRNHIARMDRQGRNIVEFLKINHKDGKNPHGVTNVSLAKKALCKHAEIRASDFSEDKRSSYLPIALTDHFGMGALLFCPNNKRGHRHGLPFPSAASQMFGLIADSDSKGAIAQVAKLLHLAIVKPIAADEILHLDVERFKQGFSAGISLADAVALLDPASMS